MPVKRRTRILALTAGLVIVVVAGFLWIRFGSLHEGAEPDYFEFGTVYVGSKVEFSAQMLTTGRGGPFDDVYARLVRRMPSAWQPTFWEWYPRNRRLKSFVPVDLTTLKPSIAAPPFLRVIKLTPDQNKHWFKGRPFVVADLEVDTSRAGDYSGIVTVAMNDRRASLPVHVMVRARPEGMRRLLIATTPYQANSTEYGSNFHAVARVITSSGLAADYLNGLPAQLENYRTIILADSALADISAQDVARVRSFVEQGGRLILPCNYFFRDTVSNANLILAGYGLQAVDLDIAGRITVTNLISDPFTLGVTRLEFHRPSPIQVTDAAQGKPLALDPAGRGGFVGVARQPGGGEIVVLASSLWWLWLDEFKERSDNERFMQNVLGSPGVQ